MGTWKLKRKFAAAVLVTVSAVLLSSCTVAPKIDDTTQASWSENVQDSGIVKYRDDGIEVRESVRTVFNTLVQQVGAKMLPPVTKDMGITKIEGTNLYLMTYESLEKWNSMAIEQDYSSCQKK